MTSPFLGSFNPLNGWACHLQIIVRDAVGCWNWIGKRCLGDGDFSFNARQRESSVSVVQTRGRPCCLCVAAATCCGPVSSAESVQFRPPNRSSFYVPVMPIFGLHSFLGILTHWSISWYDQCLVSSWISVYKDEGTTTSNFMVHP